MQPTTNTPDLQRLARLGGLLYLVIIVCGIGSDGFIRASLVVPGDAAATAANLVANQGMLRLSFLADTIMALADVGLAVVFFALLRPFGPTLALGAMVFRLVQASILGMNLMNQHAALLYLTEAPGLESASADSLALMAMRMQADGYDLGLVFFGIGCLLLGVLLWRSGMVPRAFGVLLPAAGVVYLVGSAAVFLGPTIASSLEPLYLVPVVAEVGLCLWLLVKGVRMPGESGGGGVAPTVVQAPAV